MSLMGWIYNILALPFPGIFSYLGGVVSNMICELFALFTWTYYQTLINWACCIDCVMIWFLGLTSAYRRSHSPEISSYS